MEFLLNSDKIEKLIVSLSDIRFIIFFDDLLSRIHAKNWLNSFNPLRSFKS